MMLNLLIVDDHHVLADGLKALLCKEADLHVAHHASTGQEALAILAQRQDFHVILLDISLPDWDGVALCQRMLQDFPALPIIALTMHHEPGIISRMIQAGAHGYLLKNTGREELVEAIRRVHAGHTYYSRDVTHRLLAHMRPQQDGPPTATPQVPKITRREKEVLRLIVAEYTTEEIAEQLFISASTVISHRKSLLRKLNAKNAAGLVKAAYELALLA